MATISVLVYFSIFYTLILGHDRGEEKVTVILRSSSAQLDFWQSFKSGAEAAAKEQGMALDVQGPLAEEDAEGQLRSLEAAIDRQSDAIIIAPYEDDRIRKLLARARSDGIRLVTVGPRTEDTSSHALVTSDNAASGRLAGETAANRVQGAAKVAIIGEVAFSAIEQERMDGVQAALDAYGNIDFDVYDAYGSEEQAYEIARRLLSDPEPVNTFIALNESATLGVAKLLGERELGSVIRLIGFDGTTSEVGLLESGLLDAAIVQKPFNMGYISVKTALSLIEGKRVAAETSIEPTVITKSNMYAAENQKLLFPFIGGSR